jgi:1-deoxy-D-xylulose-5-phosphate reductoisomerase
MKIARLDFEAPDLATFRCLDLAYQALAAGGNATTVLNAANEEAVAAFLASRLPFLAIAETIERCLAHADVAPAETVAAILDADLTARRHAQRIIATLSG